MTANEYGVSFCSVGNLPIADGSDGGPISPNICKYIPKPLNHIHFKRMDFIVCKFYLKRKVLKLIIKTK